VDSPVGPLRALEPPFNIDGVEPVMKPVPALGEHTDAILGELGFDDAIIAEWRRTGIV
jgi:crotonobetainyl-CoA:carnitine CoA-transferase CaiB-like acyl-CoA transferase